MDYILLHLLISFIGVLLMRNGALMLTKGATALSTKSKVSGLRVGLTIVALGTSIPEIAVSLISSLKNEESLAFGTIIGSNTFNIVFGLGIASFFIKIKVFTKGVWRDLFFAISGGILLFILLNKQLIFNYGANYLTASDALILTFYFCFYYFLIFSGKKTKEELAILNRNSKLYLHHNKHLIIRNIILGILVICVGAYIVVIEALLLNSTTTLSSRFIGVSIMAVCTSLPEITTTISAMRKKRQDIAFGNILGSYVINFLIAPCILTIKGEAYYDFTLNYDLVFSILICLLCVTLALSSRKYLLNKASSITFVVLGILYYITTYLRG